MTQWYYVHEGRQAGPVDDAMFRQWIAEGRIGPEHMVWCEGMTQWQAAGTVPGLFAYPSQTQEGCDPQKALAAMPTDGTAGRSDAGAIMGQGWRSMARNVPLLLGAVIVVTLINAVPNVIQQIVAFSSPSPQSLQGAFLHMLDQMFGLVWTICVVMPLILGTIAFSLRVACRQSAKIDDVFSGFRLFGKAIGLQLWMILWIFLWSLLLIVPGIIAALRYSQAIYLITYRPNLGINQAVKMSCEMMKGHKGRLFVIYIFLMLIGMAFFIPVVILIGIHIGFSGMTPGAYPNHALALAMLIGMTVVSIPLAMYQWMVLANFHRDLTPPRIPTTAQE